MARRHLAAILASAVVLAAPVARAEPSASLEERLAELRTQAASAAGREEVLTSDLAAATERIVLVEGEVERLAGAVGGLEARLAASRARLAELEELLGDLERRVGLLRDAEREAQLRLEERLVELYQTDAPDELELLFLVRSFDDLISQLDYTRTIAVRDREIAREVAAAASRTERERRRAESVRAEQARETAAVAAQTVERRAALEEAMRHRDELAAAQADRQALLAQVQASRHEAEEDIESLERESERLAATLRERAVASASAPAPGVAAPSSSGLVWPVDGPVTSGYGMRWGRLHAGIDIGVGFGTPIRAAAAGTVVYSGWLGGYGNLVVVDHGGGLSTAYAHQQRILVSGGRVEQGQVLGGVGSTGNSTGPHLHFEVRVNGAAVDPLGYL